MSCTHLPRYQRNAVSRWPRQGRQCAASVAVTGLRVLFETHGNAILQAGHIRDNGGFHEIYYEVHGAAHGAPVVVVHGGPGAGCYVNHTRFFDLNRYKVVLLDQRGCGRSTPRGCLVENNTAALVSDLELLRQHLGIDKWLLFGGSWGVTLSLAYALAHPHRVTAMILRGVCTMRQQEIDWMYGGGAGVLKPWAWQRFLDHLDLEERQAPLLSYYRRLLSPDASCRDAAARSWMEWEMSVGFDSRGQLLDWDGSQWSSLNFPATSPPRTPPRPSRSASSSAPATASAQRMASSREYRLETRVRRAGPPPQPAPTTVPDERLSSLLEFGLSYSGDPGMSTSTAQALLECHYSVHGAFLRGQHNPISTPSSPQAEMSSGKAVVHGPRRGPRSSRAKSGPDHDAPLLERVHALRHIPAIAVHGQMDLVCPPTTAFELHRAWPELQLRLVPGALHSMYDPAITHELVEATTLMYDVVKQA